MYTRVEQISKYVIDNEGQVSYWIRGRTVNLDVLYKYPERNIDARVCMS